MTSYNDVQLDVLKEIVNIGGGNAATSISELVGRKVDMTVPDIDILKYEELYSEVMEEENLVDAVLISIGGAGRGVFLYVIEEEYKDKLVKMMLPEGIELDREIKDSALKELVNILVNSFLSAISKMLELDFTSSIPVLTVDMFGAILSSVYIELGQSEENIMMIRNEFIHSGEYIDSSLYFIPEPGVLEGLFNKLGI